MDDKIGGCGCLLFTLMIICAIIPGIGWFAETILLPAMFIWFIIAKLFK